MTYLSYSGYKTNGTCQFQYWNKYVNKTRLKLQENGVNSLYGSTIGIVFEAFYRDRIWKNLDYLKALEELAEPTLDQVIKDQIKQGRVIDWFDEKSNYPKEKEGLSASQAFVQGRKELLSDVYESIPRGVDAIRSNRFVGPFMEAEMKLDTRFGPHTLGGRADFVVKRVVPHKDLVIVDGKGSRHREKYVDGTPRKKGQPVEGVQLKWYAVLYRELHNKPPDTLAYLFWRYAGKEAIEYVPFDKSDLDALKNEMLSTVRRIDRTTNQIAEVSSPQAQREMREELYPAQPGFHCNLCSYLEVCEEGRNHKARSQRKPRIELPEGVDLSLGLGD